MLTYENIQKMCQTDALNHCLYCCYCTYISAPSKLHTTVRNLILSADCRAVVNPLSRDPLSPVSTTTTIYLSNRVTVD